MDKFVSSHHGIMTAPPAKKDQPAPKILANGNYMCSHACKDKLKCAHACCKQGKSRLNARERVMVQNKAPVPVAVSPNNAVQRTQRVSACDSQTDSSTGIRPAGTYASRSEVNKASEVIDLSGPSNSEIAVSTKADPYNAVSRREQTEFSVHPFAHSRIPCVAEQNAIMVSGQLNSSSEDEYELPRSNSASLVEHGQTSPQLARDARAQDEYMNQTFADTCYEYHLSTMPSSNLLESSNESLSVRTPCDLAVLSPRVHDSLKRKRSISDGQTSPGSIIDPTSKVRSTSSQIADTSDQFRGPQCIGTGHEHKPANLNSQTLFESAGRVSIEGGDLASSLQFLGDCYVIEDEVEGEETGHRSRSDNPCTAQVSNISAGTLASGEYDRNRLTVCAPLATRDSQDGSSISAPDHFHWQKTLTPALRTIDGDRPRSISLEQSTKNQPEVYKKPMRSIVRPELKLACPEQSHDEAFSRLFQRVAW